MSKIVTEYVFPPIPVRGFDWRATREGWEPGEPYGAGATEAKAIEELIMAEEDLAAELLDPNSDIHNEGNPT